MPEAFLRGGTTLSVLNPAPVQAALQAAASLRRGASPAAQQRAATGGFQRGEARFAQSGGLKGKVRARTPERGIGKVGQAARKAGGLAARAAGLIRGLRRKSK